MEEVPILQTWTIRRETNRDYRIALQTVRDLGFKTLELGWTAGLPPAKLAKECKALDLSVIGVHVPPLTSGRLSDLVGDIRNHCKAHETTWATVMMDPSEARRPDAYRMYADLCRQATVLLDPDGIRLCYHVYNYDFVRREDLPNRQAGVDYLMDQLSPQILSFELDTYWVRKAGLDPDAAVEPYASRTAFWHVNDCNTDGRSAPLGEGTINWSAFMKQLWKHAPTVKCVLEHDTGKAFPALRASLEYWSKLQKKYRSGDPS